MGTPEPPARMDPAELQETRSNPSIEERLECVDNIIASISDFDQEHEIIATKLLEIFAITPHDPEAERRQEKYEKRKLFCAAQRALQLLQTNIMKRLKLDEVDETEIDHDNLIELEKKYRVVHFQSQDWSNEVARDRFLLQQRLYADVMMNNVSTMSEGRSWKAIRLAICCLLGDPFRYHDDEEGELEDWDAFQISDYLDGDELNLWKTWTYKFAVGLLIRMATSVSEGFNRNAVKLLGTMLPASRFE